MTEAVFKNHEELAYLDLCKKIIETGNEKGLQKFITDYIFKYYQTLRRDNGPNFRGVFMVQNVDNY